MKLKLKYATFKDYQQPIDLTSNLANQSQSLVWLNSAKMSPPTFGDTAFPISNLQVAFLQLSSVKTLVTLSKQEFLTVLQS